MVRPRRVHDRPVGHIWAPAAHTSLATEGGAQGWVVIARVVLLAGVCMGASARADERYLAKDTAPAPA
ncbi:MAG: hypothetical protein M3237_03445 [Actinomycetota bacterium]|nr:hypothetical protein [Actinomycetota bacterium]